MSPRQRQGPLPAVRRLLPRPSAKQLQDVQWMSAWARQAFLPRVQSLPARQAEASLPEMQCLRSWQDQELLRTVQQLSPWQSAAFLQREGMQRLRTWEVAKILPALQGRDEAESFRSLSDASGLKGPPSQAPPPRAGGTWRRGVPGLGVRRGSCLQNSEKKVESSPSSPPPGRPVGGPFRRIGEIPFHAWARRSVEVAAALMYMLTRPRNVTIRDMIVLPSNFDV